MEAKTNKGARQENDVNNRINQVKAILKILSGVLQNRQYKKHITNI